MMHFRPLHDRVVIEPLDREEKTAGGSTNETASVTTPGHFADFVDSFR